MKERDSNGRPTSPFMEKFLSGPGVIESERLKRVDRLAHSFKLGTYEGDDKGNKVAVKVGLVGRRIIKSLDIWEHLADVEDRHTVLELDNDYNGDGPIPHSFTATQEVYLDEELSSVETYSNAPGSVNNLRLRNVLRSLKVAKQLERADQPSVIVNTGDQREV